MASFVFRGVTQRPSDSLAWTMCVKVLVVVGSFSCCGVMKFLGIVRGVGGEHGRRIRNRLTGNDLYSLLITIFNRHGCIFQN